jgi:hypothetical protein
MPEETEEIQPGSVEPAEAPKPKRTRRRRRRKDAAPEPDPEPAIEAAPEPPPEPAEPPRFLSNESVRLQARRGVRKCPTCGKQAYQTALSSGLYRCNGCGALSGIQAEDGPALVREAMAAHNVTPADMLPNVPTGNAGGVKIVGDGNSVRLYTKKGIFLYRRKN